MSIFVKSLNITQFQAMGIRNEAGAADLLSLSLSLALPLCATLLLVIYLSSCFVVSANCDVMQQKSLMIISSISCLSLTHSVCVCIYCLFTTASKFSTTNCCFLLLLLRLRFVSSCMSHASLFSTCVCVCVSAAASVGVCGLSRVARWVGRQSAVPQHAVQSGGSGRRKRRRAALVVVVWPSRSNNNLRRLAGVRSTLTHNQFSL